MSGDVVYHDRDGDRSQLEVSTGGPLGVLFTVTSGADGAWVSLDREAVEDIRRQLGYWLAASPGVPGGNVSCQVCGEFSESNCGGPGCVPS